MQLNLREKFKLNIGDENTVLEGTYRPLTKAEQKKVKEKYKDYLDIQKKINKKIFESQKIQSKLEILKNRSQLDKISKYHKEITDGEKPDDAKERYEIAQKSLTYLNKLEKLNNEIFKIKDEVEVLTEELEGADIEEKMAIESLAICVKTEQTELLNDCIEEVGIQKVMEAIQEAVNEGKSKGTES